LTAEELIADQMSEVAFVQGKLGDIPSGNALALLNHFKWSPSTSLFFFFFFFFFFSFSSSSPSSCFVLGWRQFSYCPPPRLSLSRC